MSNRRFPTMPESIVRLPQPPVQPLAPEAFVLCPLKGNPDQWTAQQWLYQRAFEEAQAVVRPSILERNLLTVWN